MTTMQKIIKYVAIIFAFFLIYIILVCVVYPILYILDLTYNDKNIDDKEEYNINIDEKLKYNEKNLINYDNDNINNEFVFMIEN